MMRPALSPQLLLPDLLSLEVLGRRPTGHPLNPLHQLPPCEEPIDRLTPFSHTLHFKPGGEMLQVDAAGSFVDLLPSCSGGSNKPFLEIFLKDAEGIHLLPEPVVLFFADGKTG